MKKFLFGIVITSSIFIFTVPASASGVLQTTNQNGALYLTTQEVSASSSAIRSIATPSGRNVVGSEIIAPTGYAKDVGALINFALQAVIVVSVLLVFGTLIVGGIQWITSGGEKSKTEGARNKIVAAIIGLLLVAASYAIFLLILRFLGFKDLNDTINRVGTINNPQVESTPVSTTSSQLRNQNLVQ